MSWYQTSLNMVNKRTGKPLAVSTIRKRVVKALKAQGYKIKHTRDVHKVVAVSGD